MLVGANAPEETPRMFPLRPTAVLVRPGMAPTAPLVVVPLPPPLLPPISVVTAKNPLAAPVAVPVPGMVILVAVSAALPNQ